MKWSKVVPSGERWACEGKGWWPVLSGSYSVKLDEKGRFILPVKLRDEFLDGLYITVGHEDCLVVYTKEHFDRYVEQVQALPQTVADNRKYLRMVLGLAFDQVPDKQGRTVIQPKLREVAKLEKDLVVVGLGDHLEIWNESAWDAFTLDESGDFAHFNSNLFAGM